MTLHTKFVSQTNKKIALACSVDFLLLLWHKLIKTFINIFHIAVMSLNNDFSRHVLNSLSDLNWITERFRTTHYNLVIIRICVTINMNYYSFRKNDAIAIKFPFFFFFYFPEYISTKWQTAINGPSSNRRLLFYVPCKYNIMYENLYKFPFERLLQFI